MANMNYQSVISIIMPIYNCALYLRDSISSIINQTFPHFEFIIVNDGSTDASLSVIQNFDDERILLLDRVRTGQVSSLNSGLEIAHGEYIAIMHGDDIATPQRLAEQLRRLSAHEDVGIVGSACHLIDSRGMKLGMRVYPETDLEIRWAGLFDSPFAHPSIMFRRKLLCHSDLRYSDKYLAAEDYDLWMRMLKVTKAINIRDPLINYRVYDESVSGKNKETQLNNRDAIGLQTILDLYPECGLDLLEFKRLRALFIGGRKSIPDLDYHKTRLVEIYFNVLSVFAERHSGAPGLEVLKFRELLRIIARILRPPVQKGSWTFLRRLLLRDLWRFEIPCGVAIKTLAHWLRQDFSLDVVKGLDPTECRHMGKQVALTNAFQPNE